MQHCVGLCIFVTERIRLRCIGNLCQQVTISN